MRHCKPALTRCKALLVALAIGLAACSSTPPTPAIHASPSDWQALPNWQGTELAGLRAPLAAHCAYIVQRPNLQHWQPFCNALKQSTDLRQTMMAHLRLQAQPHTLGQPGGLATAYYEPVFKASLLPGGEYTWPLYAAPEAGTVLPRSALTPDAGGAHPSLKGRELAWLSDPIDAYLVQVQGSTRLVLPDGRTVRLAFAGSNQHPFASAANALIRQGVFSASEASNERLRQWASQQSRQQVQTLLNTNPRFIFFKRDTSAPEHGPVGALGIALHAQHSVAVDPAYTPLGSLLWLDTPALPSAGLKLAQDTGSAIKGPARVDIYFGTGEAVGQAAGKVKHAAKVWLITPKPL